MKNQIEKGTTQMFMRVTVIGLVLVTCLLGLHAGFGKTTFDLESRIAFASTRRNPECILPEVFLMSFPDVTNLQRLTDNDGCTHGDGLAALSPDGKKIIFDSNRNRAEGEPINTSDLFVMNTDGTEQIFVVRGSSATWSPNSKLIAFHASASGLACPVSVAPPNPVPGCPSRNDPGPPTWDSDIFVANLDDLLNHTATPTNLTNNPVMIDDDASWSPPLLESGQLVEKIVFTSHPVTDNPLQSNQAEIYVINTDGTGLMRLTFNTEEERGPSWSPDGTQIVYACRKGDPQSPPPAPQIKTFEICVMNADGNNQVRLTNNTVQDLTPTFSPDGEKIVFHRGSMSVPQQIWIMNADGTGQTQMTFPPGINNIANWGLLRVHLPQ